MNTIFYRLIIAFTFVLNKLFQIYIIYVRVSNLKVQKKRKELFFNILLLLLLIKTIRNETKIVIYYRFDSNKYRFNSIKSRPNPANLY